MQNQKPSLFRVVSVDYPSQVSFMFPVVFWVVSAYFFYTGNESMPLFVLLSIIASVVGIPFLFWRYWIISSVFEDGMQTQGIITGISFYRGRGRLQYSYNFQGQKYTSGNVINRSKYTRNMEDGQQVAILVDRNNPKRAFVKEIYLD
jgi:hypothetical protein